MLAFDNADYSTCIACCDEALKLKKLKRKKNKDVVESSFSAKINDRYDDDTTTTNHLIFKYFILCEKNHQCYVHTNSKSFYDIKI